MKIIYYAKQQNQTKKKNLLLKISLLVDKNNQEQNQPSYKQVHQMPSLCQVPSMTAARHGDNVTRNQMLVLPGLFLLSDSKRDTTSHLPTPPQLTASGVTTTLMNLPLTFSPKHLLFCSVLFKGKNTTHKQTGKYIKPSTFNLHYFWITSSAACLWKAIILQTFN